MFVPEVANSPNLPRLLSAGSGRRPRSRAAEKCDDRTPSHPSLHPRTQERDVLCTLSLPLATLIPFPVCAVISALVCATLATVFRRDAWMRTDGAANPKTSRRLAAILAADIAGYSALMGADEASTVRSLKENQAAVLPMIKEHGGRVIEATHRCLMPRR